MNTTDDPARRVAPRDVFVGRRDLLDALIPQLAPKKACVADIYGVEGIGKSRFLEQLVREGRQTAPDGIFLRHSALELSMGSAAGGQPVPERYVVLLQRFCSFLEQVRDTVLDATGRDARVTRQFEKFRLAVQAAKQDLYVLAARIEKQQKRASVSPGAKPTENEERFRVTAEDRRTRITLDFADALQAISFQRALLWAIDDFECVAGRRMGDWLERLIAKIEGGLVVLSRAPTPPRQPSSGAAELLHKPIRPLAEPEVREFLERCLPGVDLAPQVFAIVHEFTAGHAATLGVVAELLQQKPELAADADLLASGLKGLPPELEERLTRLVDRIVPESDQSTVAACALARRFDADLLAAMLGEPLEAAEKKIELLRRRTFIEGQPDPDTGATLYRLQGFLRRGFEQRMRVASSTRHAELHARAADFYYRWLADFDEQDQSSTEYGGWYRYEDRRWQRYMREWLYHQAAADRMPTLVERQRQASRMRFTRVFLDAFWWWGCYIEFPFCRNLIDDWRATQQDVDWLEDVVEVIDRYPTGWRKAEAQPEDWDAVRRALLSLRRACGLDVKPDALPGKDERHTRGMIDLFLADAARYRTPADSTERLRRYADAVGYYEQALQLFRIDDDSWDAAWALLERSELHGEHASDADARADWDAAVVIVRERELEDEELVANLHRVKTDIEWRRGNTAASLTAMGKAITHAYLFQNRPHPPDIYTAAFYQEMLDRATMLLGEVWQRTDWTDVIKPLLEAPLVNGRLTADEDWATGPESLVRLLPRGPADDELGRERSEFLGEWLDICERIASEADDDLAEEAT